MNSNKKLITQFVTKDDQQSWLSLWASYQQFYGIKIPKEVSIKTWQRVLNLKEAVHSLAWPDSRAVDMVSWITIC